MKIAPLGLFVSGVSLACLALLPSCGGADEPKPLPSSTTDASTDDEGGATETETRDVIKPTSGGWTGKPDPSVVGGPGKVVADFFHPDNQPDANNVRPEPLTPTDGGRVIVHLASMPKHINYMTENSAVGRWILREVHDSLIMHDWSTWEHTGRLAKQYWVEDRVELKDGTRLVGERTVKGDQITITPLAPGNTLGAARTVALDEIEGTFEDTVITCDLVETNWHDGHAFDADDVYFTWQAYRNQTVDCEDGREGQSKVTECEVLDKRRIRFTFGEQYFLALDVFEDMTIVPSHHYNLSDPDNVAFKDGVDVMGVEQGEWINDQPHNFMWIGLGPYKMVEVNDQYLEAVRVDGYFDQKYAGHVDKIRWRCMPDDQAAKTAVVNGELDYFARLRSEEYLGAFANNDKFKESLYAGYFYQPRMQYVAWNARRPQFAEKEVRQAFAHAIDWDEFIRTQSNGLAVRVTSTVYYLSPFYDHSIRPVEFDLDKSEELLDDAGWIDHNGDGVRDKDGVELVITYLMTPGNKASSIILLMMQESLGKIGVKVTSEEREWATFIERVKDKDYDAMGLAWVLSVESDPFQLWHSESGTNRGSNYPGVYNERIDELIGLIQVTVDREQRSEYWKEFQQLNYELQPYMFTYNPANKFVMSKRVRGFKAYGLNPGYSIRDWFLVDQ